MQGIIADIVIIIILALIVGWALWYIKKNKKNGIKCIGCPNSGSCSGSCSSTAVVETSKSKKKVVVKK